MPPFTLTLTTHNSAPSTLTLGSGTSLPITACSGFEAPPLSLPLTPIAQLDGAALGSVRADPRTLTISCRALAPDPDHTLRRALIDHFAPDREGTLTATLGAVSRVIRYHPAAFAFTEQNLTAPPSFTVSLLCPSPYWRDVNTFAKNMAGVIGFFAFPLAIPPAGLALSYREFRQEAVITNAGIRAVGLHVIFRAERGPVADPVLHNLTDGTFIRLHLTMQQGDILTVCTVPGAKRVELNGANVITSIDRGSSFFSLAPGDTILKYDAAENVHNLDVYPRFTPEYAGI